MRQASYCYLELNVPKNRYLALVWNKETLSSFRNYYVQERVVIITKVPFVTGCEVKNFYVYADGVKI